MNHRLTCCFALFLLSFMVLSALQADAIYKCADASGSVIYTNDKERGKQKGCRTLVSTTNYSASGGSTLTSKRSDFPTVSRDSQKKRDLDRKRILQNEFDQEKKRMEAVEGQLASADEVSSQKLKENLRQHKSNLSALKKELSRFIN